MENEELTQLDYVTKGLSKLPFVKGVILFGSQINRNPRKDSDIDIAILTKDINEKQKIKILGFSSEKLDISIFNQLPLVVQFRVIKDGKILFLKDKEFYHKIKYEVIRRYLDFAGFINNFYKKVIKNV